MKTDEEQCFDKPYFYRPIVITQLFFNVHEHVFMLFEHLSSLDLFFPKKKTFCNCCSS